MLVRGVMGLMCLTLTLTLTLTLSPTDRLKVEKDMHRTLADHRVVATTPEV